MHAEIATRSAAPSIMGNGIKTAFPAGLLQHLSIPSLCVAASIDNRGTLERVYTEKLEADCHQSFTPRSLTTFIPSSPQSLQFKPSKSLIPKMYRLSHLIIVLSLVLFSWSCWSAPLSTAYVKRSAVVPTMTGSPVIFGQGTYPRANSLSDSSLPAGSIIGAYTAFSNGDNVLRTVKSTDKGASWQAVGEVTRGPSNANDIDNPYVLQLPSGRVLCAFRNHSKDPKTGAYLYFRITVAYSDDLGKTWKYLSTPSSDPGPVNGNWEPFLRNAQDGSLQLYYSRENSAADQDTLERFSTDGGQTWTKPQTISGAGITSRDGMYFL